MITVAQAYDFKKTRSLTVSIPGVLIIIPEIRLCGKWLQDIGFEHGQTIKVKQEKNKITITVDEKNQTDE
ncbi:SymE family type I addiction module toxin [Sinomicrobium sp. M5D2P9]